MFLFDLSLVFAVVSETWLPFPVASPSEIKFIKHLHKDLEIWFQLGKYSDQVVELFNTLSINYAEWFMMSSKLRVLICVSGIVIGKFVKNGKWGEITPRLVVLKLIFRFPSGIESKVLPDQYFCGRKI